MPLLTGRQLKRIFDFFSPFYSDGHLKPETERVTILASNANTPFEVQARAFAMAAASGQQSPMIVQLSHNALLLAGSDVKSIKPPEGAKRRESLPVVDGARLAAGLIQTYVELYGAELVAVSLDHFKVPGYSEADYAGGTAQGDATERRLAEARILAGVEAMRPVFGPEAQPEEKTLKGYTNYLCGAAYHQFKKEFLLVVEAIRPAWGMIDTEKLPPLLDFVVTRDVSDAVRQEIGNEDMLIEAEFGATGQSGKAIAYEPIRGKELEEFAGRVAAFIKYTGAEGIAYPIGMEHAAKLAEKHEPDMERIEVVQRTILLEAGRYVPFAQHGGTGAASVARGLVGKNNINTRYLVAGANALADHVEARKDAIRAGDKDACGARIFTAMSDAVVEAVFGKLREAGSFQKGAVLLPLLK